MTRELGCLWYDGKGEYAQLRACVSRSNGGWHVTSFWPGREYNCGGLGTLTEDEAKALAEKFVTGQPVPEDLGGPLWEEMADAGR